MSSFSLIRRSYVPNNGHLLTKWTPDLPANVTLRGKEGVARWTMNRVWHKSVVPKANDDDQPVIQEMMTSPSLMGCEADSNKGVPQNRAGFVCGGDLDNQNKARVRYAGYNCQENGTETGSLLGRG